MSDQTPTVTPPAAPAPEPKNIPQWLGFLEDLTDKLTLRRIATVFVGGLLATALLTLYENRSAAFAAAYALATGEPEVDANWELSDRTREQLTALTAQQPLVGFVSVVQVDLKRNRRWVRFRATHDEALAEALADAGTRASLPQPVFDMDPKNTQQMVAVLQNEFSCARWGDTVYARFAPGLGARVPVVCRLAVPPFYGRFAGYLTLGLTAPATKAELDTLRLEAARLAVEIYLRDVARRPLHMGR